MNWLTESLGFLFWATLLCRCCVVNDVFDLLPLFHQFSCYIKVLEAISIHLHGAYQNWAFKEYCNTPTGGHMWPTSVEHTASGLSHGFYCSYCSGCSSSYGLRASPQSSGFCSMPVSQVQDRMVLGKLVAQTAHVVRHHRETYAELKVRWSVQGSAHLHMVQQTREVLDYWGHPPVQQERKQPNWMVPAMCSPQ